MNIKVLALASLATAASIALFAHGAEARPRGYYAPACCYTHYGPSAAFVSGYVAGAVLGYGVQPQYVYPAYPPPYYPQYANQQPAPAWSNQYPSPNGGVPTPGDALNREWRACKKTSSGWNCMRYGTQPPANNYDVVQEGRKYDGQFMYPPLPGE